MDAGSAACCGGVVPPSTNGGYDAIMHYGDREDMDSMLLEVLEHIGNERPQTHVMEI